jgi:hypothetical protein
MTDKDKTRQKLVDSMRKTKMSANDQAKANGQKEKLSTDSEQSTPNLQSDKPKTKPKSKTTRTVVSDAKSTPKASARSANQDPYQSGRRMWPD